MKLLTHIRFYMNDYFKKVHLSTTSFLYNFSIIVFATIILINEESIILYFDNLFGISKQFFIIFTSGILFMLSVFALSEKINKNFTKNKILFYFSLKFSYKDILYMKLYSVSGWIVLFSLFISLFLRLLFDSMWLRLIFIVLSFFINLNLITFCIVLVLFLIKKNSKYYKTKKQSNMSNIIHNIFFKHKFTGWWYIEHIRLCKSIDYIFCSVINLVIIFYLFFIHSEKLTYSFAFVFGFIVTDFSIATISDFFLVEFPNYKMHIAYKITKMDIWKHKILSVIINIGFYLTLFTFALLYNKVPLHICMAMWILCMLHGIISSVSIGSILISCYPFENKTKVSSLYSIMICIVPYIYIFYLPIFIFKKAKENPIK